MSERAAIPLIAHRGWARRYPENTLAAVRAALAAGAGWVEIDVQLSADRVPFLMHDRTLERMTGARGPLWKRSARELDELCACEAGAFGERFAGERVARLDAFVALLAEFPAAEAFVELKRASIEVFGVDAVLDAVLPALQPARARCRLISFDLPVLAAARARCDLELGPVVDRWSELDAPAVARLQPEVVFADVDGLPAAGPLAPPRGRLAVYEVAEPALARALWERGATWIETFDIGPMLAACGGAERAR